jgi:hypothetical protein
MCPTARFGGDCTQFIKVNRIVLYYTDSPVLDLAMRKWQISDSKMKIVIMKHRDCDNLGEVE